MKTSGVASGLYRRLAELGRVAGALTFLFGIPYGIEQYLEKQQEARINQTLDLFKQFNSMPLSAYRVNISKALIANNAAIASASAKGADALENTIFDIIEKAGIETDLRMTTDFFDALVTCIEKNLCDRDMAQRLFSPRARELMASFFQYIEQRRKSTIAPDSGIGLQIVATMKSD